VYIGSGDHYLYAHDLATGAELWQFGGEAAFGTPTPHGAGVYVTSGRFAYALE
jgi:outer membrane protein assembly factor BamB